MIVVFVGGLYDDYRADRTRGVLAQLAALRHGRVLPGVVKLAVIGAGAGFTCWMLGGRGWRFVVGTGVMAGGANLWNLLDVRPGRALKYFLPTGIALALGARGATSTVFVGTIVVAGIALVADLAEWAMLGDSGSNVLGFLVGVGAFTILRTEWLALVLGGILALHALAETVTLSRLIERTPPLRWFDGLGRRKFDRPG